MAEKILKTNATVTPELAKKIQETEIKNEKRINRYAQYQAMRANAHGRDMSTPIIKTKEGDLLWLNRKQRRALKSHK